MTNGSSMKQGRKSKSSWNLMKVNLWNRAKAVLRGKFMGTNAYIKNRKIPNK
jgi:hypothetical protein